MKRLRFFLFKAVPALAGQGAEAVRDAITRAIVALPEELYRSLTWDQGAEMAEHATLMIEYWHRDQFCAPRRVPALWFSPVVPTDCSTGECPLIAPR